jgi:ATP-binding cassette subfamily C (CFTR/MRP) protein 4
VVTLSILVSHHFFWFYGYRLGMKARVATIGLVNDKITRLSQKAFKSTTTGNIINLMSVDAGKFERGLWTAPFLWIAPVQAVIMIYFLYSSIGVSGFLGFALIAVSFPIQAFQGKKMGVQQRLGSLASDKRIKVMTELITGLRVMKMFAWEQNHAKIVEMHREGELFHLNKRNWIRAGMNAYSTAALGIMSFFTFLLYSLLGNELTAEKVYGTLSIFFLLKWQVVQMFPYSVQNLAENLVSVARMDKFMNLPEFEAAAEKGASNSSGPSGGVSILLQDMSATWADDDNKAPVTQTTDGKQAAQSDNDSKSHSTRDTLSHINLEVKTGETVAIVGPVGCGKTSLLMTLMGELQPREGKLEVHGKVAYAAQQAFGFSGTVRDNVIMEAVYDAERFTRVIQASALIDDFQNWDDGEKTEVGEKGITLSGGQKARIGLARALYADAGIVLLDDPLSAGRCGCSVVYSVCVDV